MKKSDVGTCTFRLCWGDGYITVDRHGYEYQYRCPCSIGQQLPHEIKETKKDGEQVVVGCLPTWNDNMDKSHGYKLVNAYRDYD